MQLDSIFADVDVLYAVIDPSDGISEFTKALQRWDDIEYLYDFLSEHEDVLKNRWKCSVDEAVYHTRMIAHQFFLKLEQIRKITNAEQKSAEFKRLFIPLRDFERITLLPKMKVYCTEDKRYFNWLRFYAIELDGVIHIITGSAIKLYPRMQDSKNTIKELVKLQSCRDFLINEGIYDQDGLSEYLIELGFL